MIDVSHCGLRGRVDHLVRHRGPDCLTLGELRQDLADAVADRESPLYRRQPAWAEHVEDRIDALEDELARRERQAGLGR